MLLSPVFPGAEMEPGKIFLQRMPPQSQRLMATTNDYSSQSAGIVAACTRVRAARALAIG